MTYETDLWFLFIGTIYCYVHILNSSANYRFKESRVLFPIRPPVVEDHLRKKKTFRGQVKDHPTDTTAIAVMYI